MSVTLVGAPIRSGGKVTGAVLVSTTVWPLRTCSIRPPAVVPVTTRPTTDAAADSKELAVVPDWYRQLVLFPALVLGVFAVCFIWLGVIGSGPGTAVWETWVGRVLTFLYFAFFLTMPIWSAMGQTKDVPARIPDHD